MAPLPFVNGNMDSCSLGPQGWPAQERPEGISPSLAAIPSCDIRCPPSGTPVRVGSRAAVPTPVPIV
jgi:hypothetical protein